MTMLTWDEVGKRLYETGVDKVALYIRDEAGKYSKGVAWNGVTAINESPSGAEPTPLYADNIKYLNLMSAEEFAATLEAYMYPDEFMECDGSASVATGIYIGQQPRKTFGLAYRSLIGNDTLGNEYGYKINLIYGCLASPSEKAHSTVNDSPEPETMSWEISTTPVAVTGHKPTATMSFDSTKLDKEKLASLEAVLYGSAEKEATLPLPDEIIALLGETTEPTDPEAQG